MAGLVKSGQNVACVFTTANPTTGAAVNADSLPTGLLYVNGVVNAATVTVTNITTGVYKASLTLPTLAGGDGVDIRISATVSTVAGEAVVWSSSADTKRVSDLNDSAYAGGAVASVTGAVGSVTGNVGGNVTGSVGSVVGAVGSVTAPVTLAVTPPTAAQIDTQLTGTHGAGLWQQGNTVAPLSAAATANAVWDESAANHSAGGSFGAFFSGLVAAIWAWGGRTLTGGVATAVSPVTSTGDIWITIGDDYGPVPAGQQRITHTFKAGTCPDYTGGSAVYAAPGLAGSPFAATLVTVGAGVDQTFALDLAHATTAGLPLGDYPFALEATTATGQRTTPREGVIHVRPATP